MKKLLSGLVIMAILIACSNSSGNKAATDTTSPNTPALDNVNGNVPETTNTTNLNQPLPIDSSKVKDSMKKK